MNLLSIAPKKQGDAKEAHIGMQAEQSTTVPLDLARGDPAHEVRAHAAIDPHTCESVLLCASDTIRLD
jgi:hypothetical protein